MRSFFNYDDNLSPEQNQQRMQAYKYKKVPKDILADIDAIEAKYKQMNPKKRGVSSLIYFIFIFGLMEFIYCLNNLDKLNSLLPYFILSIIALIGGIIFFIFEYKKIKKLQSPEKLKEIEDLSDKYMLKRNKSLDVPDNSIEVDILFKQVRRNKNIEDEKYTNNIHVTMYVLNNNLVVADVQVAYQFPLSDLKEIVAMDGSHRLPYWNKKEAFNSPKYSNYNIKYSANMYVVHGSYRLVFGDIYIEILPYDYDAVTNLIGRE